ncbi:50S ribosomal protein L20, partial [Haemophilus influenzae]
VHVHACIALLSKR